MEKRTIASSCVSIIARNVSKESTPNDLQLSQRLWSKRYTSRKQPIEELFRCSSVNCRIRNDAAECTTNVIYYLHLNPGEMLRVEHSVFLSL